jgi:hypothetical protein
MRTTKVASPQETKDIVDSVDVAPIYFNREDGAEVAVVSASFLREVLAFYRLATNEELTPDHEIYELQINHEPGDSKG